MFKTILVLLNGNFLLSRKVLRFFPLVLFVQILALVYIANGFLSERGVVRLSKSGKEIKELRSQYITSKAKLMNQAKQSAVLNELKRRGMDIEESTRPPIIISRDFE